MPCILDVIKKKGMYRYEKADNHNSHVIIKTR